MIVYPAIDLINRKAVRLEQGNYDKKTEYSDNPIEIAQKFESEGAEYIHIVDLDGAKTKRPVNMDVIKDIAKSINIPVQVGGGIRTLRSVEELLEYAKRVIIGTIAVTEPEVLEQMVKKIGSDKIVVSVDYKNGSPAINGWLEEVKLTTEALQVRLSGLGIRTVIVTDTDKDGILSGPNIKLMKQWKQAGFDTICAGGVTTVNDIAELAAANIDGAIIGKALYEDRITLKEAIDAGE